MPARRRRLAALVVAVLTVALLTAGGVGVPATATVLPTAAGNAAATGRDKPTIVLVHGVFADSTTVPIRVMRLRRSTRPSSESCSPRTCRAP